MNNPLLQEKGLPVFESIKASHIEPAIDHLLSENRNAVESLLKTTKDYNWDNLLQKFEDMDDKLNQAWSPASHLHSVADSDDLRAAYNACLPKLSDYSTEMGQNEGLFHAYETIANSDAYNSLNIAQQKIIKNALRDFRLSGIDLDDEAKSRYKIIQKKLSKLQTKFEENLLDATHAWKKLITNKDELAGLPDSAIALAAQAAKNDDKEGWLFTLDFPSYMPIMQYADNAELRKEVYTTYVTRAAKGDWDNSDVMLELLKYRTEKAKLLGFESYAHYSLATKMAEDPKEVMSFLNDLAERTQGYAKKEFEELNLYAKETASVDELDAWDVAYYSEKLRQNKFDISQEVLRPYFPANQVIEGLFAITNKLYGVTIKQRDGVQVWHKDVMFFDIFEADGSNNEKVRGSFYLDLYARQHKRGGAWMDECIVRKKSSSTMQDPVAYLTCNFTPPIGDKPALLTHDEVTTLFHEFGHGLHHMMTRVDYSGVSGINGVPWDAVELPSQFMENWCWEKEALDLFARHIDTGEALSEDLFEKMTRARTFQAGMQMVRQLEFSLFDFRLHLEFATNDSLNIQDLLNEVRQQVAVVKAPEFNRFQHSFSHIFAGGYAAGYYSYKWAEVLSADAFSKFEEKGIFDKITGSEFLQTILEQGGSREPMDLFVEFRGRKPSIEPLLRHSGITA
ncbi:MAG TPA: oligopeptidase A [Thiotrichaceae bacterium]|jgi:oligopeptidase A|nr:oligopeptidase A [Thiotrichaceae bacterium]HIM09070.1 oligopeptidase A [Gammaproteobacteria bacterium]